jgi:hypothetical protein
MNNKSTINLYAKIFDILPKPLQHFFSGIRVFPRYSKWYLSPKGRQHLKYTLEPYKNKYRGHRCIVIGNGPSLRQMDLEILRDEYTFGLNRIYLLFEEWGFETTFLVSINGLVIKQFANEIAEVNSLKILNWASKKYVPANEKTAYVSSYPTTARMQGNILNGYYPLPGTVTNVALELAFFMGFSEVILIGVDHNFVEKGIGGEAIVSENPDKNHFSPNYFGKGIVWQLPNYEVMENGYKKARTLFHNDGRQIVDATVAGNLRIFPKVDFLNHLKNSKYKNKE